MKKHITKLLSLMIAVLMCVCSIDTYAFAYRADNSAQNGPVFKDGDLTYTFSLQGSWNNGYNASIRIENHSNKVVEDWRFEMEYAGSISNIWNAVIENHSDGKYIIKNAGWNQDIGIGSFVEFGLSGGESFDKYPTSYKMLNGIVENSNEDYSVDFKILNDWNTGFTGEITISNKSGSAIEDWVLEFDGPNEISNIWDGELLSHEGTHYIVKNASYNQNIAAGSSVSFHFNVDNRSSAEAYTGFVLKSYGEINQPAQDDTDIQEPGTFDSIGEAYYKTPSAEDIITDEETGFHYVRNQLLISAYMGAEKSIFEEICNEIGAEIVGYIELTNDYQIEFLENKTLDEMVTIAEYLDSFSFISTVTLNMVSSCEANITQTNDTLYNDNQTSRYKDDNSTEYNRYVPDLWAEPTASTDLWGLAKLRVLSAWDYESSFVPVKVGVYDNYFTPRHEDLRYAGLMNNPSPDDIEKVYHGTHVAGILCALHNNKKGISGVATNAELYAYGGAATDSSSMAQKVAFANLIGNNVKVINYSVGSKYETVSNASRTGDELYVETRRTVLHNAHILAEFLNKFIDAGYDFVICSSAGNTEAEWSTYHSSDPYPDTGYFDAFYNSAINAITDEAVKSRIIVVGALTQAGKLSTLSNRGDRIDFLAPGTKILSTVDKGTDPNGYALNSGTSMATPFISGIAALMYQANPTIRASHVKLIMQSSSESYFDGKFTYSIPNAARCIEIVNDYETSVKDYISWPSGTLVGDVIYNDTPVSGVTFTAIRKNSGDYNIGTYNAGEYSFQFTSDDEGTFLSVLPQGVYDITYYKEGYLPACRNNVPIDPNKETVLETVKLLKWQPTTSLKGAYVRGTVTNALNGQYESGVTVKLRKGWNNKSGAYVVDIFGRARSVTTHVDGQFVLNVAAGSYTVELSKDGFVTGYFNVIAGTKNEDSAMVITPEIPDNEIRIVLVWDEAPADLDSHLTYYVGDEQACHLYFPTKEAVYNGETVAVLDIDQTESYGPETVTITLNADLLKDGNYFRYSVHDYTNRDSTDSKAMSMSGAFIHVYKGNEEWISPLPIPKNKEGTVWHVFDIIEDKNGNPKLVITDSDDSFYYQMTPSEVE